MKSIFIYDSNHVIILVLHFRGKGVCNIEDRKSAAVSKFRVCIIRRLHLKAIFVTTPHEGWPSPKAPPNAAHKCGLLFPLFRG